MAYAENFDGGVSFNDIWWWFVFGVRSLWRHNLTSYSCFQTNVLWKLVDIIGIFFYTHSPYFCKKSSPIHFPYDKVCVKYQAQGGCSTPTPLAYALGTGYWALRWQRHSETTTIKILCSKRAASLISRCSNTVKNVLFRSFCTPMYAYQL